MPATQEKDKERLDGSNYVAGTPEYQSAYHSELASVIGILATATVIVKHNHISTGSILIALDGKYALW